MGSTFTATASVDLFANPSHTVALSYFTTFDLLPFPHFETHFDFGFDGGDLPRSGDPVDAMKDTAVANGSALYFFDVFAGNAVNYSQSTAPCLHRSGPRDTAWRIRRGRQVLRWDDDRNRRLELR